MDRQTQIAQTILQQMGLRLIFALGTTKRVALPSAEGRLGGLEFNAALFGKRRCKVTVELTPSDLYNVTVTKPNGSVLGSFEGLDFEQMPEVIENTVEKHFKG